MFCLLCSGTFVTAQIRLSEIVSKNKNSLLVNDKSPDWIELYNPTENAINLAGYFLSDEQENSMKWAFPNCEIVPKSFLLILADEQEKKDNYLHTNFKVSSSGETIILSNPSLDFVEKVAVPSLATDISFSKIENGWTTAEPSPLMANEGFNKAPLAIPVFSHKSGVYQNDFELQISHTDSDITLTYFQNDLARPIETKTARLQLPITESTIICIQASKKGHPSSVVGCESFILQTAHDLPILSLMADETALFDTAKGMFELGPNAEKQWPFLGANFWEDLDTEAYFQYFNTLVDGTFYGHADLEMHGGRESRTNLQKTFRLKAKAKYQQPFFDHPFFLSQRVITQYKRLVIRNASGDFNAGHCRDGFLQDYLVHSGLDLDANSYQPIAVYINGQYYGLMGLREKMDKYYTWSNYQTTDIDLFENNGLLQEGDTIAFRQQYQYILAEDLRQAEHYEQAKKYFDVANLTDYFIAQIGNVSTAWPQNNIKYWRPKTVDGKWRYLLYDMDIALGRHKWTLPSEDALLNKMTAFGDQNIFINTVNAFLANETFRNYFFNRHQDLYNTVLSTEEMLPAFDGFIPKIETEMQRHFKRWSTNNFTNWQKEEQTKIRNFISNRPAYTMQYFDDYFELGGLYELVLDSNQPDVTNFELNSLKNLSTNFKGKYFKNIPIVLTANTTGNLYFSHWEIEQSGELTKNYSNLLQSKFNQDTKITAIYTKNQPSLSAKMVAKNEQSITFRLSSPKAEMIQYTIVDLLGRQVQNGTFTNLEIGNNEMELPLPKGLHGIYFLNLQQGNNSFTLKMPFLR